MTDRSETPGRTDAQRDAHAALLRAFLNRPIPSAETLDNLALFIRRSTLSQILALYELYRLIIPVHGVVMEFGCRWGRNLATLASLRGALEPFNYTRQIVGFDTFEGFLSTATEDGGDALVAPGAFGVTEAYDDYLRGVLDLHEQISPLGHIRRCEVRRGDASSTLAAYLEERPETIIALVYFDMDLYEPTLQCLRLLESRLTKGSVVAFDELVHRRFPGETKALVHAIGSREVNIRRFSFAPTPAYFVVD